jgi:ubiquinone/menaquinone biosynthesis C-methylase UbiE
VASVIFGTSFREFHQVFDSVKTIGCSSKYLAFFTTATFFAVFFRNVHGLIAYDLWVEHSQHEHSPNFEQKTRHIVLTFIFGFLGAILFPYLFIYDLAVDPAKNHIPFCNPAVVYCMLFLPMLAYFPWNIFLLKKLRDNPLNNPREYERAFPPIPWLLWPRQLREWILKRAKSILDEIPVMSPKISDDAEWNKYRAYIEVLDFTILWVLIDLIWIIAALYGLLFVTLKWPNSFYHLCLLYSIIAIIVLLLDYCSHLEYYFPTPIRPKGYFEFGPQWEYILPDGVKFCHWGGKKSSEQLISELDVKSTDTVIGLSCGQGGSLGLLPKAKLIVGIDKSSSTIKQARQYLKDKPVELLCADICQIPFPDNFFTKLYVQDGDAWLNSSKHALMSEIFRVTAKKGLFIYQGYVCLTPNPDEVSKQTDRILNKCGYPDTNVPHREKIPQMFELVGFRVESITSLHDLYLEDNRRMLESFERHQQKILEKFSKQEVETIGELLKWENELFSKNWWSGIRVIARKD